MTSQLQPEPKQADCRKITQCAERREAVDASDRCMCLDIR